MLEDEPIIGFALEDMLLAIGFQQVELTTTLEAACLALDSAAFDVAILDVNIHGQRSYPVAALLQAQNVPIVFATGYGDAEHPEELRSVPTVTKPYSLAEIRRALDAAQA